MNKYEFTNSELEYINQDIFDTSQDIYAWAKYDNMPKFLPNRYTIKCLNLPAGKYTLYGKHIDLHFNTKYRLAYTDDNFMDIRYIESDAFSFIVKKPSEIMLQVKMCKDIERIVAELRKQAVLNQRKLDQQESLIQKDIKAHTNLGERYNTMSFYDTIEECLSSGTDLLVDETKSPDDIDVRYLQMMKAIQDISRIEQQQKALELEKVELENKKNDLLRY